MKRRDAAARRRRSRPVMEALEGRDLPSAGVAGPAPAPARPARAAAAQAPAAGTTARRERFSAAFSGPYTVGPGRSAEPARQVLIRGGGAASAFMHGDMVLAFAIPKDPSRPITGTAALYDKNYSTTGTVLILDLEGEAPGGSAGGRVTRMSWTVSDDSGGTFTQAEGEGTLEIRYRPGGRARPPVLDSGTASVGFTGRVVTNPATNPLLV